MKVRKFLIRNNKAVTLRPYYSPDLPRCNFFLFPKLKLKRKGRRLHTMEEIQRESQMVLDALIELDIQGAFRVTGALGTVFRLLMYVNACTC